MEKVDILKLKEITATMLPGMLNHLRKNGVRLELSADSNPRYDEVGAKYRKSFYQEPKGDAAFNDICMEEALYVSPLTLAKATSFHEERCLNCNKTNGLKLKHDGYNYYFTCYPKC